MKAAPLALFLLLAAASAVHAGMAEEYGYYRDHRQEFVRPEQRRVFHFLFPVPIGADAGERARALRAARGLCDGIAAELRRGRPADKVVFELADRRSDRTRGKQRWGDLGWISRGKVGGKFDEVVFGMRQEGEYACFESELGAHVVMLMNVRPGVAYTFEESLPWIRAAMSDGKAKEYIAAVSRPGSRDAGMVFVRGGDFWMGSTEREINERLKLSSRFVGPAVGGCRREWYEDETLRRVTVKGFYLDRREVTLGEYREFLRATGHRPLPDWVERFAPDDRYPVCGVSWEDAQAYASWKGKRLPTAEEWEFAARGVERRRFPWGNALPDGTRANYADVSSGLPWKDGEHDDGYRLLAPAGSYPAGATPDGILDLAGNVREWTATIDAANGQAVVKGGSFYNAIDDLTAADHRTNDAGTVSEMIGFRCACDE